MLIFLCSLLIASLQEPVEIPFFKETPEIDGVISEGKWINDKIFCVIEDKPSIGNVIYLGGRYPEKMLFFKCTHRFML